MQIRDSLISNNDIVLSTDKSLDVYSIQLAYHKSACNYINHNGQWPQVMLAKKHNTIDYRRWSLWAMVSGEQFTVRYSTCSCRSCFFLNQIQLLQ